MDGQGIAAIFILGGYVGALAGVVVGGSLAYAAGFARGRRARRHRRGGQVVLANAPRPSTQTDPPNAPPR